MHGLTLLSTSLSLLAGIVSATPTPPSFSAALERRFQATTQCYTGTQFPDVSEWLSYERLWELNKPIMLQADSEQETVWINKSITTLAKRAGLDKRVVLTLIMQESGGSLRVPNADGGRSKGLTQTKFGNDDCRTTAKGACTFWPIHENIRQGIFGTPAQNGDWGSAGLKECYRMWGNDYAKALRCYNSWNVDVSNLVIAGYGTKSYVSDIGNRLRGVTGDVVSSSCGF